VSNNYQGDSLFLHYSGHGESLDHTAVIERWSTHTGGQVTLSL
jgi:hypothetical protein